MALPYTNLSLGAIQTEFGGSNPVSLSEYYKNGAYVGATPVEPETIPTSGQITMGDFRGAEANVINWAISPNTSAISEGGSVTYTISGGTASTLVYWKIIHGTTNSTDFNTYQGSTTTNGSGGGTFVATTNNDTTTEGSETFAAGIYSNAARTAQLGSTSSTTIILASDPPTYDFGTVAGSINEGASGTYNVNTSNVSDGTTLYWSITHGATNGTDVADFSAVSGSFTINSNAGSFNITALTDALSESNETFTVTLRTGSTSGTIQDTTAPQTVVNVVPSPTYAFGTIPASLPEGGSSGTFNVNTSNVSDGTTLYWTINHSGTSASDFLANSGSFTINSNTGSFDVTAKLDTVLNEGNEAFTAEVRTGSTAGPIVATSSLRNVTEDITTSTGTTTYNTETSLYTDAPADLPIQTFSSTRCTINSSSSQITAVLQGFKSSNGPTISFETPETTNSGNSTTAYTADSVGSHFTHWKLVDGTNVNGVEYTVQATITNNNGSSTAVNNTWYSVGNTSNDVREVEVEVNIPDSSQAQSIARVGITASGRSQPVSLYYSIDGGSSSVLIGTVTLKIETDQSYVESPA